MKALPRAFCMYGPERWVGRLKWEQERMCVCACVWEVGNNAPKEVQTGEILAQGAPFYILFVGWTLVTP